MSLRPCAQPGCPTLVKAGRCIEHQRETEAKRGSAVERGYDARWAAYAAEWKRRYPMCGQRVSGLSGEHSRCAQQGKLTTAASGRTMHCDHIQPVAQGGAWYDPLNHQTLCKPCHDAKTRNE